MTEIAATIGLLLAGGSLAFTGFELRRSRRATQSQYLFQVMTWYLESDTLRQFYYRLSRNQWAFDPDTFRGSPDEPHLDRLLYLYELVEQLIRSRTLRESELSILGFEAQRVLHNIEVERYLQWLDAEYVTVRPGPAAFPLARALAARLR